MAKIFNYDTDTASYIQLTRGGGVVNFVRKDQFLHSHNWETISKLRLFIFKRKDTKNLLVQRGKNTSRLFVEATVSVELEGDRGSGPPPPPLRFVRGGVLCRCLMDRRGSTMLFLSSLASIIRRVNVWKILITSKFQSLFSQIVIHTIPRFHESAFQCLLCLKLHNFTQCKPNIFWGRTSNNPPPPHLWHHGHILQC